MRKKLALSALALSTKAIVFGLATFGTAWSQSTVVDGTLSIFTGPANVNAKFVVGPAAGQVQVFGIGSIGEGAVFQGVRGITLITGAGDDQLEFVIDSPQSLDLVVDTGSGTAETKVQWRVPQSIASAVGSLDLRSGGGSTRTFVEVESAAPDFRFGWNMNGGGGDKQVFGKFDFRPGSRNVTNDIAFSLGGGRHAVSMEVNSEAVRHAMRLNTGAISEISTKISSPNATESLSVDFTTTAPKTALEVQSAANVLNLNLGGNYGPFNNEVLYSVAQTRPGVVTANLGLRTGVVADKLEMNFSGPGSRLSLGGSIVTGGGNDEVKIETDMTASTTLGTDLGTENDRAELLFKGPLFAPLAGLPRILGGDGNDAITLVAEQGFTGQSPRINCGPGTDQVRGFGVILNCETRQ